MGVVGAEVEGWVHRFHVGRESVAGIGVMEVRRGSHPIARALCSLLRMPRSGAGQHVAVRIERSARGRVVDERWVRTFGGREVRSHLVRADDRLTERFGCFELRTAA